MALVRITDVTTDKEPVTLDEIKHHLRLSTVATVEDDILKSYITVARQYAENETKRAFAPQTWLMTLDDFPDGGISIPRPPLTTVSTNIVITYVDTNAVTQTLAATAYFVDDQSEPGFIVEATAAEWPDTNEQINAVKIQYVCGHTICPESAKHWIKLRVGDMYENREAIGNVKTYKMERSHVDGLLDEFRIMEFSV